MWSWVSELLDLMLRIEMVFENFSNFVKKKASYFFKLFFPINSSEILV